MSRADIRRLADETFGDRVELAVDTQRGVVAAGGALHAQGEERILGEGSRREDV